jgi:hypothetical protein
MSEESPYLMLRDKHECMEWILRLDEHENSIVDVTFPEIIFDKQIFHKRSLSCIEENRYPVIQTPFDLKDFPDRSLIIRNEDFDFDGFICQGTYWSEKVREKLDCENLNIEFLPLDDSLSVDSVKKKKYMTLHVRSYYPLIDLDKSSGLRTSTIRYIDGEYRISEKYVVSVDNIVWRDDFVPDCPIFRVFNDPRTFVTREFAEKFNEYNFSGIGFLDLNTKKYI